MKWFLSILALWQFSFSQVQDTLASEDFEGDTASMFLVNYSTEVMNTWPASCGQMGVGINALFDTPNVDFDVSNNGTYFLGLNVEDPCGGVYEGTLLSDSVDATGYDSVTIQFQYFISEELWGTRLDSALEFEVYVSDERLALPIETFYNDGTIRETWIDTSFTFEVPEGDSVFFLRAYVNGGEGFGLDNFEVLGWKDEVVSLDDSDLNLVSRTQLYFDSGMLQYQLSQPSALNFVRVYNLNGEMLKFYRLNALAGELDLNWLSQGTYFIQLVNSEGLSESLRVVTR